MLQPDFFDQMPVAVAKQLLGKIIRRLVNNKWLAARIIETEAYYLEDKASHAYLGFTHARRALFMPPGTIYMYYARGKPSLNVSCKGKGNAVLIKSGIPFEDDKSPQSMALMKKRYPKERHAQTMCSGQTLLCRALSLTVSDWNARQFLPDEFYIEAIDYQPSQIITTTRLGIPKHRDPDKMYRFIDYEYAAFCTDNPLRKRKPWPYLVENY